MDCVTIDIWHYRAVFLFSPGHKNVCLLKWKMTSRRFSSFSSTSVNNVAVPNFASSKCVSHQQFTLCIWRIVVLTLHSLNGGNEKKTPIRGCLQCFRILTWNKKELQCKNKSDLNVPHNAKPPGAVCAQKEHLDWGWFSVVTTFYSPLKTRLRKTSKRKCTTSKCKENIQIILFVLFQQNKES